jgi:transcriptional regulator
MYTPAAFAVTDPDRLAMFIAEHSFAAVITQHEGAPFASHLPLLLDRDRGPHGTLVGHMAKANPQWREAINVSEGIPALAIFSGPHTYISPTWYAEPNTVPTWNYVAVHATGRLTLMEDSARLLTLLARTVDYYEASLPQPWRLASQDAAFIEKLLASIIGFEIAIEKLAGKWKLNQNHPPERRERVIASLEKSVRTDDRAIAAAMRTN